MLLRNMKNYCEAKIKSVHKFLRKTTNFEDERHLKVRGANSFLLAYFAFSKGTMLFNMCIP